MKVFIPTVAPHHVGGPTTFLRNFYKFSQDSGICLAQNIQESDLFFFPVSAGLRDLYFAFNNKIKSVQRLDGLHYFERNGYSFVKRNLKIQFIYHFLSDYKIFQSEYSKRQCFHIFSPIEQSKYTVIMNGCDLSIFFPDPDKLIEKKIIFVTSGNFRHEDMIKPITDALDRLKGDFILRVIGPVSDQLKFLFNKSYIKLEGSCHLNQSAEIIRDSHIYLFSALNSACPNALIEAVSCGIPIVAYSSGAVSEICHFSTDLLAETPDKILHSMNDFDANNFYEKILKCISEYKKYKELACQNYKSFPLEKMGESYFDFFKKLVVK
jgi:glycosyltransferase involved in cell wall biosynthesis